MINFNTITMWTSRNLPSLLTGVGMASGIAACIECGRASIEAHEILEKMHYESEEEPTMKEKVIAVLPVYSKTLILLAIMEASILGAQIENDRKIMALAALCSKYEKELEHSEEAVKEIFGENKLKKVKTEVAKKDLRDDFPSEEDFHETGTGSMKFKDTVMGGCFKSDIEFVKHAFNNIQMGLSGSEDPGDIMTVEDLLYELRRPRIGIGSDLGWTPGERLDLDIQPEKFDKEPMELTSDDMKDVVYLIKYTRPKQLFEY